MEGILREILQIVPLRVGLQFIDSLNCLTLDVAALSLDLDVRHLHLFDVGVAMVDEQLVDTAELVGVDCVVLSALEVRGDEEFLEWSLFC